RNYVKCVQITMAESFGVEDRGHFYEPVGARRDVAGKHLTQVGAGAALEAPVGALRDVVVNHLMQVVAAAAMEPPAGGDPATLNNAKVALFKAMPPADPAAYVPGH